MAKLPCPAALCFDPVSFKIKSETTRAARAGRERPMSDHTAMTFEQRVDGLGLCLNDTEDDIIDCIRRHRSDIAALTIQKMSRELYVAPIPSCVWPKNWGTAALPN